MRAVFGVKSCNWGGCEGVLVNCASEPPLSTLLHLFPREPLNQSEFSVLSENEKNRFGGPFGRAQLPRFFVAPYKFFTRLPRQSGQNAIVKVNNTAQLCVIVDRVNRRT